MAKFILIVTGVYLMYYAANFIFDAFIKAQSKDEAESEEEEINLSFIQNETEEPIDVSIERINSSQSIEKSITNRAEETMLEIIKIEEQEPAIEEQEPVTMEVIAQAIPYSELMNDSKQIFSDINLT